MKSYVKIPVIFVVFCLVGLGCSEDDESSGGTLNLELWGEEYIEESIPASEFADGFSVTFDKFLINLSEISVSKEGASPEIEEPDMKIWDLTEQGPFEIASVTAPSGGYHHCAYVIEPANSSSASGNGAQADVQMMIDNGYSVYVEGTATDGSETKTFAWGFDTATVYDPCESSAELGNGGEATVQITIHGDHLFYDDAVSEDPSLRFSDIALADANEDGAVTAEELADYDITPLPNYGVGSLDVDNLWDFISHMTSTLGHIDGEGHCN